MNYFEKITQDKVAVHCKTEVEANQYLEWLDNKGIRWAGGDSLTKRNVWDIYKENTCYRILGKSLHYGKYNGGFYEEEGYNILEFHRNDIGIFEVGDMVQIKSLDEMISEFGKDEDGDPNVNSGWNRMMNRVCGEIFCITRIGEAKYRKWLQVDGHKHNGWLITTDMIKRYKKEEKEMKKCDLQTGMKVRTRNGDRYLIILNGCNKEKDYLVKLNGLGWNRFSIYDQDMNSKNCAEFDIMEVSKPHDCSDTTTSQMDDVIWEREEPKEMTFEEIQDELGYKIKIVE